MNGAPTVSSAQALEPGPPACAVRDPQSHRIVGDGFRIAAFELDESGTQIAR